jgi:hypothetical protein
MKPDLRNSSHRDGIWRRIPLREASEGYLGVIRNRDEFEFFSRVTLPQITNTARMWLPLASTDSFQRWR